MPRRRTERLAGRGLDWYDGDPELGVPKPAADSLVLKLGEAGRRLPAEFDERRADPLWRRASGMRHRLAHEYAAVDHELVWNVMSVHVASLRQRVELLLQP